MLIDQLSPVLMHNHTHSLWDHKWCGCSWAAASSHLPPGRRGKTSSLPSTLRNVSRGRSVPIRRPGSTRCVTRWRPGTSSPSSRSTPRESTSWSPYLWPTDTSVHNIFNFLSVRGNFSNFIPVAFAPGWLIHSTLLHPSCFFIFFRDSLQTLPYSQMSSENLHIWSFYFRNKGRRPFISQSDWWIERLFTSLTSSLRTGKRSRQTTENDGTFVLHFRYLSLVEYAEISFDCAATHSNKTQTNFLINIHLCLIFVFLSLFRLKIFA